MKVVYDTSDKPDWVWSTRDRKKVEDSIHTFLVHYGFLAKAAFRKGRKRYSIVQKHHLFAHYAEQCKWCTPRTCRTYGPESFMSVVKRIAASCDRGTAAWQVAFKVCSKFALAHHLILKGWMDLADDE